MMLLATPKRGPRVGIDRENGVVVLVRDQLKTTSVL